MLLTISILRAVDGSKNLGLDKEFNFNGMIILL